MEVYATSQGFSLYPHRVSSVLQDQFLLLQSKGGMSWNEEYKIYVGGLSWCTSEPELEDVFSRCGKILDTRIIIDRFSGRSRGYGFVTFANRRGMDNAMREINGHELESRNIILVRKANSTTKREHVEPSYLSGGRVNFTRGARSMVHDRCYECGYLGHWARDCPLPGRRRPSSSSRYRFERDDSEDSFGEDRDQYVVEQFDEARHSRVKDHCDSKHDKDGCYDYHHSDRVASTKGTSNAHSSCSNLVDCEVGNVTMNLTNKMHLRCEKCKNYSYSIEDRKQKNPSFQNEDGEGEGDGEACLSLINFSQENSRTMLATMVLLDELSFKRMESEKFQKFCRSLQPKFVIPSRVTIIKDWFQIFMSKRKLLKNALTQSCQRDCLTINTWTSVHEENYMALTARFIDNDWYLHERILNFCKIPNCEGDTIGRTAEKCLLEWGINRVCTITVENTSCNEAVVSYLRKKFIAQDAMVLNGEFLYVRSSSRVRVLFINDAWKHLYKSIVQIRDLVKNITSSPAMLQIFKDFDKENILPNEDLFNLDASATWTSDVLVAVKKFQNIFQSIIDQNPRFFSEVMPSLEHWENICAFINLLTTVVEVTSNAVGSLCVAPNEYFHNLCLIQALIREYSQNGNLHLSRMICILQAKFNNYWGASKRTNFLPYVAVVLDPRYKLKYLKHCFREFWEEDVADKMTGKVKRTLRKMYDEYFFDMIKDELNTRIGAQIGSSPASMAEKFREFLDKEAPNFCKIEVDNYLHECCHRRDDKGFDVLKWWKLNSSRFLIFGRIAKDIFAIPLTTATLTLETEPRILDRFRCAFPPKMLEAIVCARNWLQSKPFLVDVGNEIVDIDEIDEEFAKISMEMNLDAIAD